MYRSVIVALLVVVGACAGGFGAPPVEASKTIGRARTVGVISAVGSKFAVQKVGITVFGNELNEVAIESWGIDDAVARKVTAALGGRFSVRRINAPKGAFAEYDNPAAFSDSSTLLQGIVRKLAASQNLDLVVVVTRAGVPFSSTNQTVAGLGMVEAGGALYADNVHLYAVTTIHVYDGRTFERLHWQRTGFEFGATLGGAVINAPTRKLDQTWWPATPRAVHNDKLRAATRALVEQSVAAAVPQVMGQTK